MDLKNRLAWWRGSTRVGAAAVALGLALMFTPEQMNAIGERVGAALALMIGLYGLWTRGTPPGGQP